MVLLAIPLRLFKFCFFFWPCDLVSCLNADKVAYAIELRYANLWEKFYLSYITGEGVKSHMSFCFFDKLQVACQLVIGWCLRF